MSILNKSGELESAILEGLDMSAVDIYTADMVGLLSVMIESDIEWMNLTDTQGEYVVGEIVREALHGKVNKDFIMLQESRFGDVLKGIKQWFIDFFKKVKTFFMNTYNSFIKQKIEKDNNDFAIEYNKRIIDIVKAVVVPCEYYEIDKVMQDRLLNADNYIFKHMQTMGLDLNSVAEYRVKSTPFHAIDNSKQTVHNFIEEMMGMRMTQGTDGANYKEVIKDRLYGRLIQASQMSISLATGFISSVSIGAKDFLDKLDNVVKEKRSIMDIHIKDMETVFKLLEKDTGVGVQFNVQMPYDRFNASVVDEERRKYMAYFTISMDTYKQMFQHSLYFTGFGIEAFKFEIVQSRRILEKVLEYGKGIPYNRAD